jgi:hypothetical protein
VPLTAGGADEIGPSSLPNRTVQFILFQTGAFSSSLLENWSITTVKYGYNKIIFVAIPSNSNNVTLVKSGYK